jgi:hypothetical protein
MANNRLYILDTESGEHIMLAKGFGNGWSIRKSAEELEHWIEQGARDLAASESGSTKLKLVTEDDLKSEIAKLNLKP